MRMNGLLCLLSAHLISLPQALASIVAPFEQVPLTKAHMYAGARLGMEVRVGATTPTMSTKSYHTGAGHLSSGVLPFSRRGSAAHLLDLARADSILSTDVIMTTIWPPGKHGEVTLHQVSSNTNQS